jgi:hypothetical protein
MDSSSQKWSLEFWLYAGWAEINQCLVTEFFYALSVRSNLFSNHIVRLKLISGSICNELFFRKIIATFFVDLSPATILIIHKLFHFIFLCQFACGYTFLF